MHSPEFFDSWWHLRDNIMDLVGIYRAKNIFHNGGGLSNPTSIIFEMNDAGADRDKLQVSSDSLAGQPLLVRLLVSSIVMHQLKPQMTLGLNMSNLGYPLWNKVTSNSLRQC